MACRNTLLPLCSSAARMSRDGYAGAQASIYIPFHGRYYFNGQTVEYPGSQVPQNMNPFIAGITRRDVFVKEGCRCG